MQKKRMSAVEFNYRLRSVGKDKPPLITLYKYCLEIISEHVQYRYGNNNFYSTVPHDIFTKIAIEKPPKKFIESPVSYLCRVTQNYLNDMYNLKDNNTLELFDNYQYFPEYEDNIEFSDEKVEHEWHKLDELTRYIIYLNICLEYKLKEIAEMLNLHPENVRTKKSRAINSIKISVKEKEDKEL